MQSCRVEMAEKGRVGQVPGLHWWEEVHILDILGHSSICSPVVDKGKHDSQATLACLSNHPVQASKHPFIKNT